MDVYGCLWYSRRWLCKNINATPNPRQTFPNSLWCPGWSRPSSAEHHSLGRTEFFAQCPGVPDPADEFPWGCGKQQADWFMIFVNHGNLHEFNAQWPGWPGWTCLFKHELKRIHAGKLFHFSFHISHVTNIKQKQHLVPEKIARSWLCNALQRPGSTTRPVGLWRSRLETWHGTLGWTANGCDTVILSIPEMSIVSTCKYHCVLHITYINHIVSTYKYHYVYSNIVITITTVDIIVLIWWFGHLIGRDWLRRLVETAQRFGPSGPAANGVFTDVRPGRSQEDIDTLCTLNISKWAENIEN